MKKSLLISVMATIILCGCQEKNLDNQVQQIIPSPFIATIESGTKTSMDEFGNIRWKKGDQISIFAGSTINEQYQVSDDSDGQTSAVLNKISSGFVAGGELDCNVAFYPYSSGVSIAKNENAYVISSISLPTTQNYAVNGFGNGAFPMAAVTSATSDYSLKFKNILGGLKIQLKGTAIIKSISVTGNNNEILCGDAEVTAAAGNLPTINLADASSKTVTLDCGTGVQLDAETATAFVISLPPMTLTGGFKVVVTDAENKQMEISTTKSQTIGRSSILKMPAVVASFPEYVDLGLSVKWATCNLGASSPEEYGGYYQWAGTQDVSKKSISLGTSPYYTGSSCWTKYIPSDKSSYWSGPDDPDDKTVLYPEDDVAHVELGGKWRMPTKDEFQELIENCTCSWTFSNGIKGGLFKSTKSGYTDKSIFLPAAGMYYDNVHSSDGAWGNYWSSSLEASYPYSSFSLRFSSGGESISGGHRANGYSVRPVYDE